MLTPGTLQRWFQRLDIDIDGTDGNIALLAAVISIREQSTASRATASGLPVRASAYVHTFGPSRLSSISNTPFKICKMMILDSGLG
jgi:hypothetical protein